MTILLTNEVVSDLLDEALALRGERYVYPREDGLTCTYVRDGKPSCLVGVVLSLAGLPLDELVKADKAAYGTSEQADKLLVDLDLRGKIRMTHDVMRALSHAQMMQDGGETWGEAVELAKGILFPG